MITAQVQLNNQLSSRLTFEFTRTELVELGARISILSSGHQHVVLFSEGDPSNENAVVSDLTASTSAGLTISLVFQADALTDVDVMRGFSLALMDATVEVLSL